MNGRTKANIVGFFSMAAFMFTIAGCFGMSHYIWSPLMGAGFAFVFASLWLIIQELLEKTNINILAGFRSKPKLLTIEEDILMELEPKFRRIKSNVPTAYQEVDNELNLVSGSTKKYADAVAKKLNINIEHGNERFKLIRPARPRPTRTRGWAKDF